MTVSVLIVDDDPLLRAGIATVLDTAADIEVVGEADSGVSALASVFESTPDVVLMDVRMPGMSGIDATKRIVQASPATKVLVLTTFGHDEYVFDALRAGASGFLLKRISPERLIEAIHTIAKGEALLDSAVTMGLIRASTGQLNKATDDAPLEPLTGKEREVLRLVGLGLTNGEIGTELFIAESTAKTHLRRIFTKLDLHDRAQAVILAYETGLVTPGRRPL
ncbi:MAG TPA: response regulator transcription factor [Actinobacteria bacterium]|nr:response regulator transcription factor [Actinomycetota bacterium]